MTLIPPNVAALIEKFKDAVRGEADDSDVRVPIGDLRKAATALEAAYATPSPARSLPTVEEVAAVAESIYARSHDMDVSDFEASDRQFAADHIAPMILALLAREGEAGQ